MDRSLGTKFLVAVLLSALVLGAFSAPLGTLPSLGSLLDPTSGVWTVAPGSRHPRDAEAFVRGLSGPVTIVRDGYGVPHIYAAQGDDGWFALGYVHAQDRLWQMDLGARAAAGRLSEVLGPDFLETDRFFRTIGLNRIARAAVENRTAAGEFDVEVMRAYAAGVNAHLASLARADLPLEFKLLDYAPEPWTEEKTILAGLLTAFSLSWDTYDLEYGLLEQAVGSAEAEELFPLYPYGPQEPIAPRVASAAPGSGVAISGEAVRDILRRAEAARRVLPDREGLGSNNWAVGGSRTSSGKPLLAADPHLAFTLPAVWYQAEVHAEPYHVRGATFPGVPGFFFGTNGAIAWGETNTGADVTDYYIETFSPDGSQYMFRGDWWNVTIRDEPIVVRGQRVDAYRVRETRHGPVLTELGQTVAMRSTLTEFRGELKAILLIAQAADWTSFREALREWRVPAQNFVYADGHGPSGNIAIRSNGLYPIRNSSWPIDRNGVVPRVPLNGSSGEFEWVGFVPFDAYPELVNPSQGFVASANQVPVEPNYAYYLGTFWDEGYRARRIHALLSTFNVVTFQDLRAFQLDVADTAAEALVPILLGAATARNATDQAALEALAAWDLRMRVNSTAATVWWAFVNEYLDSTFRDEYAANALDLPLPYVMTLEAFTTRNPEPAWFDDVSTLGTKETRDGILARAFARAVDDLVAAVGPDVATWTWGTRHTRTFAHLTGLDPLARGPIPSEGDAFTLNVAGGYDARAGSSWRQLLDFSDLNASLAIYPGGQSGNPVSPHYADLLDLYMRQEYLPFRATWRASEFLASEIASVLRLVPG